MAQRRNITPQVKTTALLTVSNSDFVQRLQKRIEIGEEIFNRQITGHGELATANSDYRLWNDYNFEMLKQLFNILENDYMSSYNQAGYGFMGQIGEIEGNPIQTFKNLIHYKLANLKSLLTRTELIKSEVTDSKPPINTNITGFSKTEVFVVHGHDDLAKTKTARFIEKLGLKSIILHEQITAGKTIIEKIEEYSNVGFGIVLYTPCDIGYKSGDAKNAKKRARQNVVFEHGYLIGKIGRKNVCALIRGDVEVPNDISGVVYVKMDEDDSWHVKIAKELKSSGYDIDMNNLL